MQFPNPIIRSLILYDASGNAVIVLGPGPSIVVKGTAPAGDIEITNASAPNTAQIRFWNTPHNDFGSIYATEYDEGTHHNVVSIIQKGGLRTSAVAPAFPNVRNVIYQNLNTGSGTFIGQIGDINGVLVGCYIGVDDNQFSAHFADSDGNFNGFFLADLIQGLTFLDNTRAKVDVLDFDLNTGNGLWKFSTIGNWRNLTLNSGWTAKAGYQIPQIRLNIDGTVQLRGTMTGGVIVDNTQIATIPAPTFANAYDHPGGSVLMKPAIAPTGAGTPSARIFITGTGIFVYGVNAGGTTDISLDGMSYSQFA